jgi:hypothetical protein
MNRLSAIGFRFAVAIILAAFTLPAQTGPQREVDLSSPARPKRPVESVDQLKSSKSTDDQRPTLRRQGGSVSSNAPFEVGMQAGDLAGKTPVRRPKRGGTRFVPERRPTPAAPPIDPAVEAARRAEYERQRLSAEFAIWGVFAGIFAVYLGLCFAVGYAARQKGRLMSSYVLLALLLTPLWALIILLIVGPDRAQMAAANGDLNRCPICGEWIQRLAINCRFCGVHLGHRPFGRTA